MKPRINLITLAVEDLERSLAFYRDGLGLPSEGLVGCEFQGDDTRPTGTIALFRLGGGMVLSLFPRSELAKDAGIPFVGAKSGEFSIGQAVDTRAEVDEVLARAAACGATVTDPPHDRPGASTRATCKIPTDTSGRYSTTPGSRSSPTERLRRPRRVAASGRWCDNFDFMSSEI